jgi:hypothetical protein
MQMLDLDHSVQGILLVWRRMIHYVSIPERRSGDIVRLVSST